MNLCTQAFAFSASAFISMQPWRIAICQLSYCAQREAWIMLLAAWYEIVYSFSLGHIMSMFMHVYLLLDDKNLVKRVVSMHPKTIFPRWWLQRLNPLAQWHENLCVPESSLEANVRFSSFLFVCKRIYKCFVNMNFKAKHPFDFCWLCRLVCSTFSRYLEANVRLHVQCAQRLR